MITPTSNIHSPETHPTQKQNTPKPQAQTHPKNAAKTTAQAQDQVTLKSTGAGNRGSIGQ